MDRPRWARYLGPRTRFLPLPVVLLKRFGFWFGWWVCLATLAGCASTRLIDSDVRSFRNPAVVVTSAGYQFERLPSQQAQASAQAQREAWAAPVLQRVGLDLASESPRYTLQLGVASEPMARNDVMFSRRWNATPGAMFGAPLALVTLEPVLYRFQVQVLVRDAQSREVVYESSAQHIGPWNDQAQIFPAVLLAAMRDFPHGNAGPGNIKVQIGPGGMELRP